MKDKLYEDILSMQKKMLKKVKYINTHPVKSNKIASKRNWQLVAMGFELVALTIEFKKANKQANKTLENEQK